MMATPSTGERLRLLRCCSSVNGAKVPSLKRLQDEILQEQILIETEGERIGQINALSVIEFPGHPRAFGEPSRISCVVHIGDGEFTDIERKAELGGNIHAKGMMIMQAF